MENTESNPKSQQTGGLKLMTVFVVVLALHVVVIGGMTGYYLMRGSPDADMLTDQTHKSVKVAPDGALPGDTQSSDSSTTDKTASTTPEDPASTASASTAPATSTPATTIATPAASAPATTHKPTEPLLAIRGPVVNPPVDPAPTPSTPVAAAPAPTPEAQPDSTESTPYVVKAHDSLARIAHQNHTSVAKLKSANNLSNDMLQIGQKLVIPAKSQVAATTPAAPAPDASGATILSAAPAATTPALVPNATAANGKLYTVMKGDTLTKIAHKFKTTPTAIMTANNITDPAKLSIGKKLKIPSQEARSATNTEPVTQPSQVQSKPATSAQLANFLQ